VIIIGGSRGGDDETGDGDGHDWEVQRRWGTKCGSREHWARIKEITTSVLQRAHNTTEQALMLRANTT
jgi:hypothetical protein